MRDPNGTRGAATWRWLAVAAAGVFGVATIVSGGRMLFGAAAREAAGDYLELVVVFNFVAGFAYVVAAAGLALRKGWSAPLATVIAVATLLVFAAVGVYLATGGAVAGRTIAALTFRSFFWAVLAAVAPRLVRTRSRS